MEKRTRIWVTAVYAGIFIGLFPIFHLWGLLSFDNWIKTITVGAYTIFGILMLNELITWIKVGKRGDSFDIIFLFFLMVVIYIFTEDVMNAFIGGFSIYMFFGLKELKDYEILNKILMITLITYNFIFVAGIINTVLLRMKLIDTWVIRDTAFSYSFWVMLLLGFLFFGRKYIVIFRFMSPQYLSLLLFVIAWLAVRFVSQYITDITGLIYPVLIFTNWIVYFISGPLLDLMLGIKRSDDPVLRKIVEEVKGEIGIKSNVKIGFARYPIMNAMAYGAFFDKRIAVIAPSRDEIPEDELKGIIGHELSHVKGGFMRLPDTLTLSIISTVELLIFWVLGWPATFYDYTFNPGKQPFPLWVFLLINMGISIIIYIFVRYLESKADQFTRFRGFGFHLAKGLYNLEGFYSANRETGLDTMLLSDEKITDYNRLLNYADTAEYIDRNMLEPSTGVLLANFLNSHPPTFHRMAAIFGGLTPRRECFLPVLLLGEKRRKKAGYEFWKARLSFRDMAHKKFSEMFKIGSYTELLERLGKKELYKNSLNKLYYYIDRYSGDAGFGVLVDIKFDENVAAPIKFVLKKLKISEITDKFVKLLTEYNISPNTKHLKKLSELKTYDNPKTDFKKYIRAIGKCAGKISKIKISDDIRNGLLTIMDTVHSDIERAIKEYTEGDTGNTAELSSEYVDLKVLYPAEFQIFRGKKCLRLITPIAFFLPKRKIDPAKIPSDRKSIKNTVKTIRRYIKEINSSVFTVWFDSKEEKILIEKITDRYAGVPLSLIKEGKTVFIRTEGTVKKAKVGEIKNKNGDPSESIIVCTVDAEDTGNKEYTFVPSESVVEAYEFGILFHNDEHTRPFEHRILKFLAEKGIRTTIYLKKPVNNREAGYIREVGDLSENNYRITVENIFGIKIEVESRKIEYIVFGMSTVMFRDIKKMSMGEKLFKKIAAKRTPEKVYCPILPEKFTEIAARRTSKRFFITSLIIRAFSVFQTSFPFLRLT